MSNWALIKREGEGGGGGGGLGCKLSPESASGFSVIKSTVTSYRREIIITTFTFKMTRACNLILNINVVVG